MLLEPVIPWLRQAILSFFDAKKIQEDVGSQGLQLVTRGENGACGKLHVI